MLKPRFGAADYDTGRFNIGFVSRVAFSNVIEF
jgi:hypothetical protein